MLKFLEFVLIFSVAHVVLSGGEDILEARQGDEAIPSPSFDSRFSLLPPLWSEVPELNHKNFEIDAFGAFKVDAWDYLEVRLSMIRCRVLYYRR